MKNKKRPLTLRDIADAVGVSTATVSLALRNRDCVARETREKVRQVTKELGYVYNRSAARLRTQKSNTIGLIVPNILNPFFTELTSSVEEEMETFGTTLLLSKTSEILERQIKALRTMLEYSVDGILLCPVTGTTPAMLAPFLKSRVPLVLFTRRVPGVSLDYIGPDNIEGARLAANHLIELGHRRIAFIGGGDGSATRRERHLGFTTALREKGLEVIPSLTISCETTLDGGYNGIQRLLGGKIPPTAAVCFNDVVAFGVILGLWAVKVTPGQDFAVVGFDNISDAALWSPPLSTISSSPRQIGSEAARILRRKIEDPSTRQTTTILEPSLIIRGSSSQL